MKKTEKMNKEPKANVGVESTETESTENTKTVTANETVQTPEIKKLTLDLTPDDMANISLKAAPSLAMQTGFVTPLKNEQVVRFLLKSMDPLKQLSDEEKQMIRDIVNNDQANKKPRGRKRKAQA